MKLDAMLWVLQFILALKFVTLAVSHGLQHHKPTMQAAIQRLGAFSRPMLAGIALLMLLGAAGLVLPAFIDGAGRLAPLSAAALTAMLAVSLILHRKSRENPLLGADLVLLALCAFTAYGP
jgi:hypothetical protein